MKRLMRSTLTIFCFAFGIFSCKPVATEDGTAVKNLDDLASAGAVKPVSCQNKDGQISEEVFTSRLTKAESYLNKGSVLTGQDKKSATYLAESLALAPAPLLDLAEKFGAKFHIVTSAPEKRCAISGDHGGRAPTSCISAPENGSPELYYWPGDASDDENIESSIRSGTLRLLAMLYTQYTRTRLEGWLVSLEKASGKNNNDEFRMQKANLELAYSTMLMTKNELSHSFLSDIQTLRPQTFTTISKLKEDYDKKDVHLFSDFVVAETIDSYYCSAQTRKTLKDKYPKTNNIFNKLIKPNFE